MMLQEGVEVILIKDYESTWLK